MHKHWYRAALLAAWLAAPAVHAQADADAFDTDDAAGTLGTEDKARCWLIGQAFYKLAYIRDGGSDKKAAIHNVSHWLSQKGSTGSHVKIDYKKATAAAADVVFARKDLHPVTLSAYGGRSCKVRTIFANAPERQEAGAVLLMQAAQACQQDHPGKHHNTGLKTCLREAEARIIQRVRTATIQVQ